MASKVESPAEWSRTSVDWPYIDSKAVLAGDGLGLRPPMAKSCTLEMARASMLPARGAGQVGTEGYGAEGGGVGGPGVFEGSPGRSGSGRHLPPGGRG